MMSNLVRAGLVLMGALALGLAGCGGGEEKKASTEGTKPTTAPKAETPKGPQMEDFLAKGGTPVAAKTPQEAWLNLEEAEQTGNAAMYMSSILATDKTKPYFESDVAQTGALRALKAAMLKAYGKEAIEGHFDGIELAPFDREAAAADLKIEMKGEDQAVGQKGDGDPMRLVKKDGKWLIDVTGVPEPDEEAVQTHRRDLALVQAVAFVLPKVGTMAYPKVDNVLELLSKSHDSFLKAMR